MATTWNAWLNLSCARPRNDRNKSALLAVNLAAKADGMPGRTPCEEEQSVSEAPTTLSDATTTPGTLSRRVSFSDDAKKPLEHMCALYAMRGLRPIYCLTGDAIEHEVRPSH